MRNSAKLIHVFYCNIHNETNSELQDIKIRLSTSTKSVPWNLNIWIGRLFHNKAEITQQYLVTQREAIIIIGSITVEHEGP